MVVKEKIINQEFLGTVLPDSDPKNQGRYKVYIPKLMPHISPNNGIWCKNQVHKWRYTKDGDSGCYGEYTPLHSGTLVIVKFNKEDYNTGYIDRIVGDYYSDSLPFGITTVDRDDIYTIYKTPKYNDIFVINEDTKDQPPNSIHLYFNKQRTRFITDYRGIHIFTHDNYDKLILGNQDIHITTRKVNPKDSWEVVHESDIDKETELKGGKRRTQIDLDDHLFILRDSFTTVKNNKHLTIENNYYIRVDKDKHETVVNNNFITIQNDDELRVEGFRWKTIEKSEEIYILQNRGKTVSKTEFNNIYETKLTTIGPITEQIDNIPVQPLGYNPQTHIEEHEVGDSLQLNTHNNYNTTMGDEHCVIIGNRKIVIGENDNVTIIGVKNLVVGSNCNITVIGGVNLKSLSYINMDAPMIYQNCGISQVAIPDGPYPTVGSTKPAEYADHAAPATDSEMARVPAMVEYEPGQLSNHEKTYQIKTLDSKNNC